jgi:hypothetical protein
MPSRANDLAVRTTCALALFAVVLGGCGTSGDQAGHKSAGSGARTTGAQDDGANGAKKRPGTPLPGGRRRVVRNGAVIILPAPPRATRTEPGTTCRRQRVNPLPGAPLGVRPPSPGISAVNLGGKKVEFHYSLAHMAGPCRARLLFLDVGVNDSASGGFGVRRFVKRLTGTETFALPPTLRDADVASARVVAANGQISPTVRVKLTSG